MNKVIAISAPFANGLDMRLTILVSFSVMNMDVDADMLL